MIPSPSPTRTSRNSLIHETIRIKSGAWDDSSVFIYSTLNHIKYCLSQGHHGVICTLDGPVCLTRVKGKTVHCTDRSARLRTITFDPAEYRFKLALLKNNYEEMLYIIRMLTLLGKSIIACLQQKGFPKIALDFIDRPECWDRLAQQALKQSLPADKEFRQAVILVPCYGNTDKMQKIADAQGDPMSRFHNALYAGDILGRISVMQDVALDPLAYLTAKTNGLDDLA
ncbi:coatomer WD associated region-domain-containing protein [Mycena olivaceomarginata]|nr:coatomer WD associated region-domain-containing protein [Mycena olivaceomarginata]